MEYYSAMKRNEIGSSVETRIDLESVDTEWSKKEKNKYCISTHVVCGIEKNGIDEPIYKAVETQM